MQLEIASFKVEGQPIPELLLDKREFAANPETWLLSVRRFDTGTVEIAWYSHNQRDSGSVRKTLNLPVSARQRQLREHIFGEA